MTVSPHLFFSQEYIKEHQACNVLHLYYPHTWPENERDVDPSFLEKRKKSGALSRKKKKRGEFREEKDGIYYHLTT